LTFLSHLLWISRSPVANGTMEIDIAYSGAKGSPVYLPSRTSYRSAVQTA
jgi:hypothetical protein